MVQDTSIPGDNPAPASGLSLQCLHGGKGMDRITEDDWAMKLPFENGQKCERVDAGRVADQPGGNRQAQQAMGDRSSERAVPSGGLIDVQWVEVSGQTGEKDDIGFRDGPSRTLPLITNGQVVKRAH